MSKLSVVIPVYNAEKYLEQCVTSLLLQTITNIEIILVDDGSTDNSAKICNSIADNNARIIVYHQVNQGVSAARKKGVEIAGGDYICFVDSDDYVESDFCETLLYAMTQNNADIAECGYNIFSDAKSKEHKVWQESMVCDSKTFLNKIVSNTIINGYEAIVLWNKIFKKEKILALINDWGDSLLEDYLFLLQYYKCVNTYVYVNKALINYRQVSGSLSRRVNKKIVSILGEVEEKKQSFISESDFDDIEKIMEESNKWFAMYVYNYLKNYYAVTERDRIDKAFVLSVVSDSLLHQKCVDIKNKNKFQTLIKENRFAAAVRLIERAAVKEKSRRRLSQIKNKVIIMLHR